MKKIAAVLVLLLIFLCPAACAQAVYVPENILSSYAGGICLIETDDAYYYSYPHVPQDAAVSTDCFRIQRMDKQSGETVVLVDESGEICELFVSEDALYYRVLQGFKAARAQLVRVPLEGLQGSVFCGAEENPVRIHGAAGEWVYYETLDLTHSRFAEGAGEEARWTGAAILCRKNISTGEVQEIALWHSPPAFGSVVPPDRTCVYYQTMGAAHWMRYVFAQEGGEEIALSAEYAVLSVEAERFLTRKDDQLWLWDEAEQTMMPLENIGAYEGRYVLRGENIFYTDDLITKAGSSIYTTGYRVMRYEIGTQTLHEMFQWSDADCVYVLEDSLACRMSYADWMAAWAAEAGQQVPSAAFEGMTPSEAEQEVLLLKTPIEHIRWREFLKK